MRMVHMVLKQQSCNVLGTITLTFPGKLLIDDFNMGRDIIQYKPNSPNTYNPSPKLQ